jgi:hypothetical protein
MYETLIAIVAKTIFGRLLSSIFSYLFFILVGLGIYCYTHPEFFKTIVDNVKNLI